MPMPWIYIKQSKKCDWIFSKGLKKHRFYISCDVMLNLQFKNSRFLVKNAVFLIFRGLCIAQMDYAI